MPGGYEYRKSFDARHWISCSTLSESTQWLCNCSRYVVNSTSGKNLQKSIIKSLAGFGAEKLRPHFFVADQSPELMASVRYSSQSEVIIIHTAVCSQFWLVCRQPRNRNQLQLSLRPLLLKVVPNNGWLPLIQPRFCSISAPTVASTHHLQRLI